jgi:FKBP-type peptidyl-prolyl cis-trans isomerase FklB
MRRVLHVILTVSVALLPLVAAAEDSSTFKSDKEKLSYSLGMEIASNLKSQGIEVDAEQFARGFKDATTGAHTLVTEEEMQATIMAFQKEFMAKQQEMAKAKAAKAKQEGEAFLASNKGKEGVVTLPSGLQYKVLKEGTGPMPTADDRVTVNYRGKLVDGTEFDSSYSRGKPATFPVKGVIPGWTEALQHMKVGSKWEIYVPASLAYGERGAGHVIAPNSTLIFEVELLGIEPSQKDQSSKQEEKPQ